MNNDVIHLWLNLNHFNITNPRKDRENYRTYYKCIKYLTQYEFEFNHVCQTDESCQKCYSSTSKCKGKDQIECSKCHVIF